MTENELAEGDRVWTIIAAADAVDGYPAAAGEVVVGRIYRAGSGAMLRCYPDGVAADVTRAPEDLFPTEPEAERRYREDLTTKRDAIDEELLRCRMRIRDLE